VKEEWRSVVGYEGLYEVSSQGRVRALARVVHRCKRCGEPIHTKKAAMVNPIARGHGYPSCSLSKNGKARIALIHRLVLEAFIGPCHAGMEACHANGHRDDARLENLRWDTRKRNHADRWAHGTMLIGEKTNSVKLTTEQVFAIRASKETARVLAEQNKVSRGTIFSIRHRHTWKHLPPME
jgi:hypothetical protein